MTSYTSTRLNVAWVGVLAAVCGCESGQLANEGIAVDSGGVRTVTYPDLQGASDTWTVDTPEIVSIGVANGESPYELSRIVGVAALGSGYLVADGGSGELRLFDANGRYVRSAGGRGSGPGEFERLRWMARTWTDSVFAWDLGLSRLTVFDSNLELVRTHPIRFEQPGVYVVAGVFANGDLLINPFGALDRPPASAQVVESTTVLAVWGSGDGEVLDTIIRVRSQPSFVDPGNGTERVPFTPAPAYATGGESVWAGSGLDGQLARYTRAGAVDLRINLPAGGEISRADIEFFRAQDLSHYSGAELAERARLLDRIPLPSRLPAFDMVRVDAEERLWVRQYLTPNAPAQHWLVFDRSSLLQGGIELPSRFGVAEIAVDRIIGTWRDDLGVESVRVYRYRR